MNIIKLYKNRNKILEGIKNNVFKTEHVEAVAAERMTICSRCQFKGVTSCEQCGCVLEFKTRALADSCPIDKWKAILSEDEEYLIKTKLNERRKTSNNN